MAAPDAANLPSYALKPDAVDADAGSAEEAAEEDSEIAEVEEEALTAEVGEEDSTAEGVVHPEEDIEQIDSFSVSTALLREIQIFSKFLHLLPFCSSVLLSPFSFSPS